MHRPADVLRPMTLLVISGLVAGCSMFGSSEPIEGDASDSVQHHAPPVANPIVETPPAGPTPAQDTPEGLLRDKRAQQSLGQQASADLARDFIEMGKEQMAASDFEGARESFQSAFELDPSNADARRLFEQVGAILGERPDSIADIANQAREKASVRRAQARIEIDRHLEIGEAAIERGDYDAALKSFSNALVIANWNPYLDNQDLGPSIEQRIDDTRTAKEVSDRERAATIQARALEEERAREQEELERTERRVQRFFAQANEAFLRERYDEAESYCEQILQLDPANTQAEQLQGVARQARHAKTARDTRKAYKENWREVFDEIEYDDLPPVGMISFPDSDAWAAIEGRGPLQFSIEEETLPAEDREVYRKLEETSMPINFDDTDLEAVIEYFQSVTGVGFVISTELADSGDITFRLNTTNAISARRGLDLLKDFASSPINWMVQDGVVKILSEDEAVGGQILNFYDIRDITRIVQNHPAEQFDLRPSNLPESFDDEEEDEPAPRILGADALVDLITENIASESWDEDGSIQQVGGDALVIRHTREVHAMIDRLLSDLRANTNTMVNVEARFLSVKDDFLEDIGVDFRGLDGQNGATGTAAAVPSVPLDDFGSDAPGVGTPSSPAGIGTGSDSGIFYDDGGDGDLRGRIENLFDLTLGDDEIDAAGGLALEFTYLDDTQLEVVMRAVEKTETANIIDSNNLTVFNGQRANITTVNNVTYVRDYDVEIAQGAVVADPVVDVIKDGTILDITPVVSADRRFVTLDLRPMVASLPRPIPIFVTSLGVGNDVILQLPELKMQRIQTTVTIPDGATLLLGGLTTTEEKDFQSGMPWLSDIPVISFLFTRKGKLNVKRKLLVLVRAKIIIPDEHAPNLGGVGY